MPPAGGVGGGMAITEMRHRNPSTRSSWGWSDLKLVQIISLSSHSKYKFILCTDRLNTIARAPSPSCGILWLQKLVKAPHYGVPLGVVLLGGALARAPRVPFTGLLTTFGGPR